MISKNDKFVADSNFCSLAKLFCTSFSSSISTSFDVRILYRSHYGAPLKNSMTKANNVKTNGYPFSFFRLSILKNGNIVHFPNLEYAMPDRAFLPSQIASQISLGPTNKITKIFPNSAFGAIKEDVDTTLSACNAEPIYGEIKSCPRSLEEMISFSKSALGAGKLLSLISRNLKGYSNTELTIKNVKKYNGDKNVVCHEVFLPFSAYYCHLIPSTSLYEVDFVEPKTGAPAATLVAICHMDTSGFSPDHISLQMLNLKPGQGEVCHWFNKVDLAWVNADVNH